MQRDPTGSANYQLRLERERRGWSQAEVALRVGSGPKSVARWEAKRAYPTPYYRQKLCELFGKTADELGLLTANYTPANPDLARSSSASVLPVLDTPAPAASSASDLIRHYRAQAGLSQQELASRLNLSKHALGSLERGLRSPSPSFLESLAQALSLAQPEREHLLAYTATVSGVSARIDWGEAPFLEHFYGREKELLELEQWITGDRCRLVALLGFGGRGKTALAAKLVERLKERFTAIFWRSLQNALPLETLLKSCLQFLADGQHIELPASTEDQITLLIQHLRERRCLLILDNVETILQAGGRAGHYRAEYEDYGRLLRRVGETQHESCLLLTSREKPKELARLEGALSPVRVFQLPGLGEAEGRSLMRDRRLWGSDKDWARLIEAYSGNALALQLVSESIREVFGGDIAAFLRREKIVFGDIQDLIAQQFQRLSPLERDVMYWLAVEREPVSLDVLQENMLRSPLKEDVLVALGSLRRRSMVEVKDLTLFTLQPVIMEYVTDTFVHALCAEVQAAQARLFDTHALVKADAREYVRESQVRLLLAPLARRLLTRLGREELEQRCQALLALARGRSSEDVLYSVGNLLNLLVYLEWDLRAYDFSHTVVRQAFLRRANLRQARFAYTHFARSLFGETFGNILSICWSPDGSQMAVATTSKAILLWRISDSTLLQVCHGHTDWVRRVAFSPDGSRLASSSDDQTVRLWDAHSGRCLHVLHGHIRRVYTVAFSPRGDVLASGSEDQTIRLWNAHSGQPLGVLQGHSDRVRSLAFSPAGDMLVSGSSDLTVRLWELSSGQCLRILKGHVSWIRSVAFHPHGRLVASGSEDHTIRLWNTATGQCVRVLHEESGWIYAVAFNADGQLLASGSEDHTIHLWNTQSGQCERVLQGHQNRVRTVAFDPAGRVLASGSEDQTIRLWDATTGQCLQVLHGYSHWIWSIAFSQDGQTLASGSEDQTVRLWDVSTGRCLKTLRKHNGLVYSVAFIPGSRTLASGGEDQTILLWDVSTGQCVQTLKGHTDRIRSLAFSPAGSLLASGSEDQTIRLWEVSTGQCRVLSGHADRVRPVAFNPAGSLLASGSEDRTIRLWEVSTGQCVRVFSGHEAPVRAVAFSPHGHILASGGEDQTIRLWDIQSGRCLRVLSGHSDKVWSLAFSPDGQTLVSGSEDQSARLWEVSSGLCLRVFDRQQNAIRSIAFRPDGQAVASGSDGIMALWDTRTGECLRTWNCKPYYQMDISGVKGLTEAQKTSLKELGAIEQG